jgi:cytidylate kinase
VAPLKPAADAVSVDSSALTIDEVVDLVLKKVPGKIDSAVTGGQP